jgi:hypothetical protein
MEITNSLISRSKQWMPKQYTISKNIIVHAPSFNQLHSLSSEIDKYDVHAQRKFLESAAASQNVNTPSDWYNLSFKVTSKAKYR